jgi:hypothetical protein
MVEDPALRQPELIFRATSRLTKREIESRLDPSEHDAIWSTGIAEVVEHPDFTPVAIGAMRLWRSAAKAPQPS